MVSARLSWRDVALGVGRLRASSAAPSLDQVSQVVSLWRSNWRYRRELIRLCELGPHFLSDIGVSVLDASVETAKPFWKV